ncbi:Metallo-beta-lactamase superfamily protein [Psychrobacillus psychrotolerans]|uniref:Metallo-beta-lactamase superfamily protein n=1 Tax=Psychrobacillus psychrotolerans TaxID=126156 RepID=A0A1I5V4N0_9BACI|nr:MBL fold metallo-hydrolase [Psychrobacillus psychrotolerans]SFQ02332.1 Metallo-beta-lactamase superfamily protein [Psychrobacillus psychrotolerans]
MLNKLSNTIYYLSNQDNNERPTLGLVCGDSYSLIIDSGNSPQHAKDFLLEIEKLNVPPVKYVVITHAHWDHFLGMNEFDATVIVNSQTNEIIKEWQSFSYDDRSLKSYVNTNQMSAMCMNIIQTDMPNRNSFKLKSPDVIFEKTLTIDLGNKVCILEKIKSTHSEDSTVIYIPDEKVVFLGDCAYGTTTNSLFHFKQSLLLPMIKDILKYNAEMFLLGHESICDSTEMDIYWRELTRSSQVVKSSSLEDALECFIVENKRDPNNNELFFIKAFVNDHIIQS